VLKEGIKMSKITNYVQESYSELVNKVTWPSTADLQSSTVIVAVASLVISLVIFAMDFIFGIRGTEDALWRGVLGFFYELF
jgi:preprotein translocase subunit SecE